jgi:hypothetical protein
MRQPPTSPRCAAGYRRISGAGGSDAPVSLPGRESFRRKISVTREGKRFLIE